MCVCVYAKFFINNFRLYIYLTHLDSVHHQLYDPLVSTYLLIFFQIHEERAFFPFFFKEKFFSPRFLFSSSTEFAFFFFFWLVSEIYPLSYLVSFNRCQNKMCRNEAFSFFFFHFRHDTWCIFDKDAKAFKK